MHGYARAGLPPVCRSGTHADRTLRLARAANPVDLMTPQAPDPATASGTSSMVGDANMLRPVRGRGVALPTSRQARVYALMTAPERQEIHDRFFSHRSDGCPLEAAWSAYSDDRSLRLVVMLYGALGLVAIALYVLLPHAHVFVPIVNRDETVRFQIVLFACLIFTIPPAMTLARLFRDRTSSHRLAAAGPDCNPWVGLEADERASTVAPWKRATPNVLWLIGVRRPPLD
jgi:hypothetical protein